MKIALISAQQKLSGSNGIEDMLLQRTLLGGGCCQKFVNKCIEEYISISPLKIIKTTLARCWNGPIQGSNRLIWGFTESSWSTIGPNWGLNSPTWGYN